MAHSYQAPFAPSGKLAVDEQLARKLLDEALSRGGDYTDVFFEYRVAGSFVFDERLLKATGRAVSLGLGVRVTKGDATGYAYVEDLSTEEMFKAARTAAQIANEGGGPPAIDLTRRSSPGSRYIVEELSLRAEGERKRELLERADVAAHAVDPRVSRVDASFHEELREILVATSDGHFVHDRQPLIRFGVQVLVEHAGKRQSGSSGGGGRFGLEYFDRFSPEWHAKQAAEHALRMLDAQEAPAGELPVVLGPGDSGILLHEAVGHGLEADFNRKKTSNYSDQIGKDVASPLCTVVDDASLAFSRGSINVDDEGNEPSRAVLIEKGVLRGYIHDRYSANHFGASATGNGRRESFKSHPMPRMTNTYLLPGQDDPEDILRSVDLGIYACKFGGGQVDIANGDFVFSLTEGYLIEGGKLTAPLKGVNLIGNGPEVMRKVVMLGGDMKFSDGVWTCGKDGQSVPVGVGCPTMKISSMTVGGTRVGPR